MQRQRVMPASGIPVRLNDEAGIRRRQACMSIVAGSEAGGARNLFQ